MLETALHKKNKKIKKERPRTQIVIFAILQLSQTQVHEESWYYFWEHFFCRVKYIFCVVKTRKESMKYNKQNCM